MDPKEIEIKRNREYESLGFPLGLTYPIRLFQDLKEKRFFFSIGTVTRRNSKSSSLRSISAKIASRTCRRATCVTYRVPAAWTSPLPCPIAAPLPCPVTVPHCRARHLAAPLPCGHRLARLHACVYKSLGPSLSSTHKPKRRETERSE